VPGIEAYDYSARYYDPKLGRFYGLDPIPSAGSPYAYCRNNPLWYVDPSGMDPYDADWWISRIGEWHYYDAISHGPGTLNCGNESNEGPHWVNVGNNIFRNAAIASRGSSWLDASGDAWGIAMDPWATSPQRIYLESNLQYLAKHMDQKDAIIAKLTSEGFSISLTFGNGENITYYADNAFPLVAGLGGWVNPIAQERMTILSTLGKVSLDLYQQHGSTILCSDNFKWWSGVLTKGYTDRFSCMDWKNAMQNAIIDLNLKYYTDIRTCYIGIHTYIVMKGPGLCAIVIDPYWFMPTYNTAGIGW